jgi:hypothetical protein
MLFVFFVTRKFPWLFNRPRRTERSANGGAKNITSAVWRQMID